MTEPSRNPHRQYTRNPPLLESDLLPDPLQQFQRWLADAEAAGVIEPTAMALATVAAGRPSLRIVLFKGFHAGGFCFYTNLRSRKALELAAQPQVAATFWWDRLERQVRLEGLAEPLPRELADAYFHSRPRGSQLAAYVSRQSQAIADRAALEAAVEAVRRRFDGQDVPLPDWWGGYRIVPHSVEFWQGQRDRLHDRLVYRRDAAGWRTERLQP